jgi:hypothetical protein
VNIPKESIAIAKMIEIVQPELDLKYRHDFAKISKLILNKLGLLLKEKFSD